MWRTVALFGLTLCLLATFGAGGCSDDGFTPRDGLYLGDKLSFRVAGGTIGDVRLFGVDCRVPHPDNEALALCLERAPGLVSGTMAPSGQSFTGTMEGVTLTGTFSGDSMEVAGTWRFETSCGAVTDEPCVGEGDWTASWREEITPDTGPDGGDPDADATGDDGPLPDVVPELPGDGGPLGPPAPGEATAAQELAHTLVLDRRQRAGTIPITMGAPLNLAAQRHADYYNRHATLYQSSGLSPHAQNPDWEDGYTGEGLGQRLAEAGVAGGSGSYEVMAFSGTTEGAIDGWMDTLYHRIPLIHPSAERWGYGEVLTGAKVQVGDFVYGNTGATEPAFWPPRGATGVATAWWGNEIPQPPLPQGESYPSGPIITVSFPKGQGGAVTSATLKVKSTGAEVPIMVRDPGNDSWLSSSWAMYAFDPLEGGTTYVVEFVGATTQSWEFTTGN